MSGAELGIFLAAGVFATYAWRFAGAIAVRGIDPESEVLRWVRMVATALVAALVARFIFVPSGLLAGTGLAPRIAALAAGLAVFFAASRNAPAGVGAAVAILFATALF
jgi:branched-subunit amino acid transport protein